MTVEYIRSPIFTVEKKFSVYLLGSKHGEQIVYGHVYFVFI